MRLEGYNNTRFEVPVDKTAYRVTQKGIRYRPNKKVNGHHFDAPPAMATKLPDDPNFKDLTGSTVGRLTVVGFAKYYNKRWVCRCSCGKYVLRTSKSIKNPENYGDRCDLCRHHAFLKKNRMWQETGKELDERDF